MGAISETMSEQEFTCDYQNSGVSAVDDFLKAAV